jgi:hypothetical protein
MREGNNGLAAYQSLVSKYMAQEVVRVDTLARSEDLYRMSALQLEALANADARSDLEQRATSVVIQEQADLLNAIRNAESIFRSETYAIMNAEMLAISNLRHEVGESNSESQRLELALKQKSDVVSPLPKYVPEEVVSKITTDLETALNTEHASSRKSAQDLCEALTKVRDLEEVIESKNVEIDALRTTRSTLAPQTPQCKWRGDGERRWGFPLIGKLVRKT